MNGVTLINQLHTYLHGSNSLHLSDVDLVDLPTMCVNYVVFVYLVCAP